MKDPVKTDVACTTYRSGMSDMTLASFEVKAGDRLIMGVQCADGFKNSMVRATITFQ